MLFGRGFIASLLHKPLLPLFKLDLAAAYSGGEGRLGVVRMTTNPVTICQAFYYFQLHPGWVKGINPNSNRSLLIEFGIN